MKNIYLFTFIFLSFSGFAQQAKRETAKIIRTHYYYMVSHVENEQAVKEVVEELGSNKGVVSCKYKLKKEKKMAEISFTMDEKPLINESQKNNPQPDVKKIITDKGLQYEGFTSQTEKTND